MQRILEGDALLSKQIKCIKLIALDYSVWADEVDGMIRHAAIRQRVSGHGGRSVCLNEQVGV